MRADARHLTWEHFAEVVRAGVPAVQRIHGDPTLDLFVDQGGRRIGLRVPTSATTELPPSPLAAIDISTVRIEDSEFAEIATTERPLYGEFYAFATSLADRVQLQHQDVRLALEACLASWRQLLQPIGLLSTERHLGLFGELRVLAALIDAQGVGSLDAWTGPLAEPHDFRLRTAELEVKATIAASRSHVINGEDQLVASPGCQLYILSLQFEPAGLGGMTLPQAVQAVERMLDGEPLALARYQQQLRQIGYQAGDGSLYVARWQFRTRPRLVPVDSACPRLTRGDLQEMDPVSASRISDVHYRVDLDGLGFDDRSQSFQAILPITWTDLDETH